MRLNLFPSTTFSKGDRLRQFKNFGNIDRFFKFVKLYFLSPALSCASITFIFIKGKNKKRGVF